jgi:hypothetical protein
MRTLFTITAVLLAAALPAVAIGSRAPSRSEKQQLRSAVKGSKLVPKKIRKGHFTLRKPRISTKGPWAKAAIISSGVYSDPFNPNIGLFKRSRGHWRLKSVGTSGVGCSNPRAPRAVRKDLKLRCS